MDRRLQEAVLKGDVPTFLRLVEEDHSLIQHTAPGRLNTVLHLAARFGHEDLAAAAVALSPEMVGAENGDMETPLHEACREGQIGIVRLLVETDPGVVYKVNRRQESALLVASERGKVEVVRHLLNTFPLLLKTEVDALTTSLHAAASAGHIEIVREIIKARPEFAWKTNEHGCTPLHLACGKGHLEITREFLRLDPDLCCLQDKEGRTALHVAAVKGKVNVIDEILGSSLESAEMTTNKGESVLHLGVKNNQYDAVRYLTETLDISKLVDLQDDDGNTVLHLATAGKLTAMVIYLLKLGVDVNAINRKGYTALDVVESDASNSGALAIVPALLEAGAKRCDQLPPTSPEILRFSQPTASAALLPPTPHLQRPWQKKVSESPAEHHRRRRKHHHRRAKQLELQMEGLRNARNTVTIVAVLIATVSFAGGINPPGGFNQESGKAMLGKHAAFKVFLVCNIVALFLSLGIVNVLVSVIPFRRKSMTKLLGWTHKVMWVSTLFMAAAFIAATWAILPRGRGTIWVRAEVVTVGGGCTMTVFLGLGVMLARQWRTKWEWRKRREKRNKDESPHSSMSSRLAEMQNIKKGSHESSNSDVDSSDLGYHLY